MGHSCDKFANLILILDIDIFTFFWKLIVTCQLFWLLAKQVMHRASLDKALLSMSSQAFSRLGTSVQQCKYAVVLIVVP